MLDLFQFTEISPGTYQSDVLFVPLVQIVDYATYPLEELGGPIVPQGSAQERIRLLRCKLDAEYIIDTRNSPAEPYTISAAWYLCKFSLQEVLNAIAAGPTGLFPYDPLNAEAQHLFKHPVVRFGADIWQQMYPGSNQVDIFQSFGIGWSRKIQTNIPMRLSMESDEEFYLVFTASMTGPEEDTLQFGILNLQARTQFAT